MNNLRSFIPLIKTWLRQYSYHFIFALAIFTFLLLLIWWSVYIGQSIEDRYLLEYHILVHQSDPPTIVHPNSLPEYLETLQESLHSKLHLNVQEIEEKRTRRYVMLIGEAFLLGLVILVSIIMLYRYILLEKRFIHNLNHFWKRLTHEAKTPLTGLRAFMETLLIQDFEKEELHQYVCMALKEISNQESLINNLLITQRMDRALFKIIEEPILLVPFLNDFAQRENILLSKAKISFDFRCDETIMISTSKEYLTIILNNLLDNAIKYSYTTPDITIVLDQTHYPCYKKHPCIIIQCKDRGIGFDSTQSSEIFKPYKRLDTHPFTKRGIGMGLYISHQISRTMKWDLIGFSEGKNRGAVFTLKIPMKEVYSKQRVMQNGGGETHG